MCLSIAKSVVLWLSWRNENCTLEMLLEKKSDGFKRINSRLQKEVRPSLRLLVADTVDNLRKSSDDLRVIFICSLWISSVIWHHPENWLVFSPGYFSTEYDFLNRPVYVFPDRHVKSADFQVFRWSNSSTLGTVYFIISTRFPWLLRHAAFVLTLRTLVRTWSPSSCCFPLRKNVYSTLSLSTLEDKWATSEPLGKIKIAGDNPAIFQHAIHGEWLCITPRMLLYAQSPVKALVAWVALALR